MRRPGRAQRSYTTHRRSNPVRAAVLSGRRDRARGQRGNLERASRRGHDIPLAGNIGVAAGWNLAALEATRPYLCFLNDDAVFVDDETPRRLLAAARTGAIAGPYSNRAKPPQGDIAREQTPAADLLVPMVVGVCLVVGRARFDRVGGFDPRFPMWDDDDFCARAGRDHTSCLIHEQGLVHTAGPWRSLEETNDYAHDWEFVSRLLAAGEPWAATTRPTLNYNTETCSQPEFLRARAAAIASRHS